MSRRRSIIVAGAGIGGLTAALTLSQAGFDVVVLERAPALDEIGAGIQLSPNATRILIGLGLEAALAPLVVAPMGMDVRSGRTAGKLLAAPLGPAISERYGAPWWVVHRADLQGALADAARSDPHVDLVLGTAVGSFSTSGSGVEIRTTGADGDKIITADALVGADGLRSAVRHGLGDATVPVYRRRDAREMA